MHATHFHHRFAQTHRAFTLVEMLVAVALVVVLMLAVTQIFSIASRTIGGGQALGASVRDAQAARSVLGNDFSAATVPGPGLVIRMQRGFAFRNRADYDGDFDKDPWTDDLNGDGVVDAPDLLYDLDNSGATAEASYSPFDISIRNHRLDHVSFFARDRFIRQTGGTRAIDDIDDIDPLVADMTSNEAAIFLHHLTLPHTSGTFYLNGGTSGAKTLPINGTSGLPQGDPDSNPQNYFASQWILGRAAVLLQDAGTYGTGGMINDASSVSQNFFFRVSGAPNTSLSPLDPAAVATDSTSIRFAGARYDLAGITIDQLIPFVRNAEGANIQWWNSLMTNDRFEVNPFVHRPINAVNAAQQVPVFIPACTQFIVEFAGDYIQQDDNGVPTDTDNPPDGSFVGKDGRIDFLPNGQVRWYGLPRDTNGDGVIRADDGDVVPVADIARMAMPFERAWPTSGTTPPTLIPATNADYRSSVRPLYKPTSDPYVNPGYTVAWGPDADNLPKMIRITITIDRPEAQGRLSDGQTFEYVFNLGQ